VCAQSNAANFICFLCKRIEDLEFSGGWQRPRVLKTKIEDLEIKRGKFSHYVCLYNFRINSPKK
jgi:hypothetical protein